MAGIFDNLNQKLNNMPFAQSMGLLSAGTSMLAGDKISDSINQGLGVYQNFNQMSEEQKRKGMIDKLISEGGFTAQEQALIRASQNPAAVAVQIRNQKLPSSALGQLKRDLDLGNIDKAEYDARLKKLK